jgi:hypothetical protein
MCVGDMVIGESMAYNYGWALLAGSIDCTGDINPLRSINAALHKRKSKSRDPVNPSPEEDTHLPRTSTRHPPTYTSGPRTLPDAIA